MNGLDFSLHNDYAWLIAGVILMVLEAIGISGVGLMFAGFGAVTAGIVVHYQWTANGDVVAQTIVFLIATSVWAYALWHPIKKFRAGKRGHYSNIIGDTAFVGGAGLDRKLGGEVTWSGTIMKAQIAPGAGERIEAGARVEVVEVTGATLVVKPKE